MKIFLEKSCSWIAYSNFCLNCEINGVKGKAKLTLQVNQDMNQQTARNI